jgi:hypothetical protein
VQAKMISADFMPNYPVFTGYQTSSGIMFSLSAFAFILFPFVLFLVHDSVVTRQQEQITSSMKNQRL